MDRFAKYNGLVFRHLWEDYITLFELIQVEDPTNSLEYTFRSLLAFADELMVIGSDTIHPYAKTIKLNNFYFGYYDIDGGRFDPNNRTLVEVPQNCLGIHIRKIEATVVEEKLKAFLGRT